MTAFKAGIFNTLACSLVLSVPLTVAAQSTPRLEVFGGYSSLRLAEPSNSVFDTANLNGWSADIKLNVTQRIGFLADVNGNYGQRVCSFCTVPSGHAAGGLNRHTFLFGTEFKAVKRERLTANVRVLVGIAHDSSIVVPFQDHQLFSPSRNWFAASLGVSVDYRISDHLSYRIVQPELLVTTASRFRSIDAYPNFRVSTGVVFK